MNQFQSLVRSSFVGLQQRQHLAKDLRGITSVYLFDDQDVPGIRISFRLVPNCNERSIYKREFTISIRSPATYEIFVREIGMELNRTYLAFVTLTD